MYKLYYHIQGNWRCVNATKTIHDQLFKLSRTIGIGCITTDEGVKRVSNVDIAAIPIDTYRNNRLTSTIDNGKQHNGKLLKLR